MSNTVAQIMGHRPVYKEDVGLEVEAEYIAPRPQHAPIFIGTSNYWGAHNDGSLRNGFEYVTAAPIAINNVRSAVADLFAVYPHPRINFSHRTSIHTHFNVQNMTLMQLYKAILGWWVFEDVVVTLCAPHRRGNQFCLPWTLAENQVTTFVKDYKNASYFGLFNQDNYKYAAMNLAVIPKLGTMEFRCLEGTYDIDKIVMMTEGIHTLLTNLASSDLADPAELFDYMFHLKNEPDKLLDRFMSPAMAAAVKAQKGYGESIKNSMIQISYAAYLDWERDKKDVPSKRTQNHNLHAWIAPRPVRLGEPVPMHMIDEED